MSKFFKDIKNLVIGLITTAKHLPRKEVTIQYPDERWPMPERSRGIVVLLSDKETGELNCTTCLLCERACPSAAITIVYEKDEKKKRHLKDFIVDNALCCFCGLCEEACNFAAIKMTGKYEFATWNKDDLVWHTDKLQEMGIDVPYEARKKRKPKPKVAKPAPPVAPAPSAESKPEQASPAAPAEEVTEKPVDNRPAEPEEKQATPVENKVDEKPEQATPVEDTQEIEQDNKNEQGEK